ncbi:MAG: ABC transporter permease [Candidatus Palauibacterales bacterium]|nr:ABC transporter permease [Candidatus Palauibacterales bacterium]MDP2482638.1 ABC transporter permease [Candidatus Palauibacterales bacterium]
MGLLRQDLRYAIRMLRKRPGFTAIAVLTIALGIAANTSIFSVVNGVLLRPLPVADQERLVVPDVIGPSGFEISLSIPNFKDWREQNTTFESFGANASRSRTLTGGERPEMVVTRMILGDWFETLGVPPHIGRVIQSDETWAGAAPIAVINYGFWQRHFGGDPAALGKTLVLDGETFTVVGVMPPKFAFPSAETDIFVPMGYYSEQMCWEQRGCSQGTWAIGKLAEGVPMATAQADLDRIAAGITEMEGDQQAVPRLQSISDAYVGDLRRQVWILMAAVGFVLLIACANVASLLLARGESRRRETALRTALGASQGRLLRQFITESVVLGMIGGLLGLGLAWIGIRLLLQVLPSSLPSVVRGNIGMDVNVLLFTFVAAAVAGLVFGIAPAIRAARPDLAEELKEGSRGSVGRGRQRLRSGLVIAEVALSLVLLIGAGLMIQSLAQLRKVDKGFDPENVFTARVQLPRIKYDGKEAAWAFYQEFIDRVEALPGATSASLSQIVPLQGNSWENYIYPEGVEIVQENGRSVLFHMITPSHFETLGIPILRGRGFTTADREGNGRVVVVDERMAEEFWPGEDPIGKRVTWETEEVADGHDGDAPRIWRTVIGVTRNTRHYELENPSRIQLYVPIQQSGRNWTTSMYVLVKTAGDPLAMTELVRRELAAMDPDVPLTDIETMEGYVDQAMAGSRAMGDLLSVFSGIALFLSAIGIFGVMSFSVVQRLREIGIRMALGAKAGDVVRMVSRQGLSLTLAGIAIGLVAAFGLTRMMASILYDVSPADPLTYGGFALFLVVVSLLAAWLPARRATRVDPVIVLREE